MEQNP
jgi:hypothetical protein